MEQEETFLSQDDQTPFQSFQLPRATRAWVPGSLALFILFEDLQRTPKHFLTKVRIWLQRVTPKYFTPTILLLSFSVEGKQGSIFCLVLRAKKTKTKQRNFSQSQGKWWDYLEHRRPNFSNLPFQHLPTHVGAAWNSSQAPEPNEVNSQAWKNPKARDVRGGSFLCLPIDFPTLRTWHEAVHLVKYVKGAVFFKCF